MHPWPEARVLHVSYSGRQDADGGGAAEFNVNAIRRRSLVAVPLHVLLEERQPLWPLLRLLPEQLGGTAERRRTGRVRVTTGSPASRTGGNRQLHVDRLNTYVRRASDLLFCLSMHYKCSFNFNDR